MTVVCPKCKSRTTIKKEGKPTRGVKCSNKECSFLGSLMQFGKVEEQVSHVRPQPSMYGQGTPTVISSPTSISPSRQPVSSSATNGGTIIEASYSSSPADGGTMIENRPVQRAAPPAIGYLQTVTGEKYSLAVGANIVGRQHPTSQATLQIVTNDGYMSRQHMKIEVIPTSNGRMEYRASDNNSTNRLTTNGQLMAPGDIVILKSGDRITIGHTDLVFKTV